MRKIFTILSAFALFTVVSCSKNSSDDSSVTDKLIAKWALNQMDISVSVEEITKSYSITFDSGSYIDFRNDGKGDIHIKMSFEGEKYEQTQELEWSVSESLLLVQTDIDLPVALSSDESNQKVILPLSITTLTDHELSLSFEKSGNKLGVKCTK